jgi:hypothetical protein
MSNFESITPSLELCRRIPSDEFDYSELWWHIETIPGNKYFYDAYVCERGTCKDSNGGDFVCFPAPTAQEILEKLTYENRLPDVACSFTGYTVSCLDYDIETINETDSNLAEAALRLWLRLHGSKEIEKKEED